MHRDPHQVHLILHHPQRTDGALQDRSVGYIEHVSFPLQHLPAFARLLTAFFRQIDIRPAGEAILLVPITLAVADQYQLSHAQSLRKALLPANLASLPSRSSIRSNWLYLAMRSVRLAEPVLIWPAPVATARSAMNGSSVSPERCDTIEV